MPNFPTGAKPATKQTAGGYNSACFYSGAVAPSIVAAPGAVAVGSDVFIASGPGRFDAFLIHSDTILSGPQLPIVFYDAAAAVSGGPIPTSGHRKIAFTPFFVSPTSGSISGSLQTAQFSPGQPQIVGQSFGSGLCFNSRSGQPGITVWWTAEPGVQ